MTRGKQRRRWVAKAWRKGRKRRFWWWMGRALPDMREASEAFMQAMAKAPPTPPITGKFIIHTLSAGRTRNAP